MQLSNIENNWWMSDCCTSAAHFFLLQMGPNISREISFKLLFGEEASHVVVHLGKVCGKELKDEGEGGLGVDDVVQRHNVRVPQLLQQACLSRMGPMSSYLKSNRNNNDKKKTTKYLSDSSEWCPLLLLKSDLL